MNYIHDRNWGCRISDEFVFRGNRMLVLENELVRVSVLIDKGSDIYEFLYKPKDIDFMWRAPTQLKDPRTYVPASPRANGYFQDLYHGGWQEILPNGGVHVDYRGIELGQHGEVSIMPWNCRIERDDPAEVAAKLSVRAVRTPFYIEKTLRLRSGEPTLYIEEKLVNEGRVEMDFMWGHHPAFGHPFLDESCRIDAPASRVEIHPDLGEGKHRLEPGAFFDSFPIIKDKDGRDFDVSKVPDRDADTSEMLYLMGLDDGWYALTNTYREVGFGMKWDRKIFPFIWLWEVFGGDYGYPWYGRTYNLALEPWTSYPGGMDNALCRGTVPKLGPGQSIETELLATAYEGLTKVDRITSLGKVEGS